MARKKEIESGEVAVQDPLAVTRVQMDLPKKSKQRLDTLKDITEASSFAEVIREALKLYEFFVLEEEEGSAFYVKRKGETEKEIKIFV